ncbi:VIT1/CCC1 transporter family protein [Tropheryma whipplei]|uniref:VIT1/CCC1 transporter family protein n=1 Tax=Tropheryma whipplei TaxID=2039 RepID=UPI000000C7B7|nr:VIT1/CCC1 transporter family protein [Tropheryma whipplei]CAD66840.1 putative membrane protein [Tropheryma whipplei TW08/27]
MKDNHDRERKKWRRYLRREITEARIYEILATRFKQKQIFLDLAKAEKRHAQHWRNLLGNEPDPKPKDFLLRLMAKYGSKVIVLSFLQRAEAKAPYFRDVNAVHMAADETIHKEVIRAVAAPNRQSISGPFRAAVFGINDGLVSNTALIVTMAVFTDNITLLLLTGFGGLLSGSLSMAAGEYVSVTSQKELINSNTPDPESYKALSNLSIDANELSLVYRARGMTPAQAQHRANRVLEIVRHTDNLRLHVPDPITSNLNQHHSNTTGLPNDHNQALGNPWTAAITSFILFATGALIPLLPFLIPIPIHLALPTSLTLFTLCLLITGAVIALLSGSNIIVKALRQLIIGALATILTSILTLFFGHH